jgi:hypothetical protein
LGYMSAIGLGWSRVSHVGITEGDGDDDGESCDWNVVVCDVSVAATTAARSASVARTVPRDGVRENGAMLDDFVWPELGGIDWPGGMLVVVDDDDNNSD